MGVQYNSSIVTNGLVLAFDVANGIKNATGNISTNLIQNGNFVNGAGSPQESESNPTNTIAELANPGNSPFVLRQNGNSTEYQFNVDSGMVANTTYVMSGWYAKSSDYNGGDTMFHARAFSSSGAHNATGVDTGTLIYSTVVNGITWEFRYQTIATPADFSNAFDWYLGYGTNNTTGYRYYTNLRLEKGTYPTLYNLLGTGSNGEVQNGVSYNSSNGGSLVFDGVNDYIQSSSFTPNITNKTLLGWVKLNSTTQQGGGLINLQSDDGVTFDAIVYNETDQGWGFGSNGFTRTGWSNVKETSTNQWVNIVATYENLNYKMYRNGSLILTLTSFNTLNYNFSSKSLIGYRHTGGSNAYLNGNIAQVSIYNKALSAAEVSQNFNALRGRFGI